MKKGSSWILLAVLILAVFAVCLPGCDFSCDLKDTPVDSPAACEKYCSKDPGCVRYTYFLGNCSCD